MTDSPPRPQPHAIEAEQALLGALLLNNDVADRLVGLEPEHFYDPVHGRLYGLAARTIAAGRTASPVSLKPFLADDEGLAELGGTDYLARLAGAAISISIAPDYARMIVDLAGRRRMLAALQEAQEALPAAEDVSEVMAALEATLAAEEGGVERESGIGLRQALNQAIDDVNEAFQGGEPVGVSLCIPALEKVIGRARAGDYILMGARPSMGKSALAIEIARRAARNGTAVVYWCAEMQARENSLRMLSATARDRGRRIPYRDALDGQIEEDEFRLLMEGGREIEGLPLHFVEPSITDVRRLCHEISRHVGRFRRAGHAEVLVVIDYLQKITVRDVRSKYESVSEASASVKRLLMRLRCPGLVLAQLSRGVESRENKRPVLSDLRDSGEIEQDANTAMFLYRDEYYLQRALEADPEADHAQALKDALDRARNIAELIVAKQRSGPITTARIGFDGATNSLWDLGRVVAFQAAAQEGFEV